MDINSSKFTQNMDINLSKITQNMNMNMNTRYAWTDSLVGNPLNKYQKKADLFL